VIPDTNVMTSTRDPAGHLWIGTQRGMYLQMRPGAPVTPVVDQPLLFGALPGSWIWQTLIDREGGLWVTSIDGGVAYLAPGWASFSRFTHVPDDPNSLRDSVATTMARGRDGRHVWVGERKGRIDRLDPITGKVEHILSGLNGDGDVLGMTEDFKQHLWIAVQGALYRYDYVHGQLDQVDPDSQYLKNPLEVEPGPDGQMYARTFGQGVYRIDPDTLVVTPVAMDKPNDKVMWGSGLYLYKGVFWYASDGGLLRFNQAKDRFEMVPGVPVGQSIDAFDFDRTGVWVATPDGRYRCKRSMSIWIACSGCGFSVATACGDSTRSKARSIKWACRMAWPTANSRAAMRCFPTVICTRRPWVASPGSIRIVSMPNRLHRC
jgi:ligand-binding sensor domain-containing protein